MNTDKSICSTLLQLLTENVKEKILNPKLNQDSVRKFKEKEQKGVVKDLTDLRDIKSKSESEVYEVLNTMVKNKQFFMYCGSLLLNINPGPNLVKDYLNLQSWVKETEDKEESSWKPHLYSFMYYVYQTLVSEKKDQVVNMLGQIGSGKTFNIIHIIEYYCCMVGPDGYQIEVFDMIHKSIQLLHILGSIFRENNLESTSCGMLLKLGFGSDNKISDFDIDAKVLDCTLPFSENGRSFSILHSFMAASSSELKRNFNLPDNEIHLNFFRKFGNNFSKKTKDRFKLNDLEIWNRFHSLLHSFGFTKGEVIEILQIFSFILMVNELNTVRITNKNKTVTYQINKGQSSKKLSKNINMDEDILISILGSFKDISEAKTVLISLMKYSYAIVFDYINRKIKVSLKEFFNKINSNSNNKASDVNYIHFLDFPGEIDDSTLGGLCTNLANECLNLYAGTSYSSVIEKLLQEKISLKLFPPLHCYNVVRALISDKGVLSYLSMPFTEDNFSSFKKEVNTIQYLRDCIHFHDDSSSSNSGSNDFKFDIQFTTKTITYNYESLYMETKSISNTSKLLKLFAASNNSIIKSSYQKVITAKTDVSKYVLNTLMPFFTPIDGNSPFVIYCLHSNNSYKLFFDKETNKKECSNVDWVIPRDLTISLLKKSLCIPILSWEWFGYHEWMKTDIFFKTFMTKDFEKLDLKLPRKLDSNGNALCLSKLNTNEKIHYIMNALMYSNGFGYGIADFIQGNNYIMMKQGSIAKLQSRMSKLIEEHITGGGIESKRYMNNIIKRIESKGSSSLSSNKKDIKKSKTMKPKGSNGSNNKPSTPLMGNKDGIERKMTTGTNNNKDKIIVSPSTKLSRNQANQKRRALMKTQCQLAIFDDLTTATDRSVNPQNKSLTNININNPNNNNNNDNIILNSNEPCIKYNIFRILDKSNNQLDSQRATEAALDKDTSDLEAIRKKNNIVLLEKGMFKMVENMLDPSKNKNFKMFDYSNKETEVIRIQCLFRMKKAKNTYFLFRYVQSNIIKLQATARKYLTIKKYKKFVHCLISIKRIQRLFRQHFNYNIAMIKRIQSEYRLWKLRSKLMRKLLRKRKCELNNEVYVDSSDEDNKRLEEAKKESASAALLETQHSLKKTNKGKRVKQYYDITKESNKDKIVSLIIRDQDLMRENGTLNRKLANQRGIDRETKTELLQLQLQPKKKDNKTKSLPKKKIEDKLIEYGELIKQKRAQELVDKLKTQEMQYSFMPETKKSQKSYTRNKDLYLRKSDIDLTSKDFNFRSAYYEESKGNNLERIKTTIVDPEKAEYTFKPKVSEIAMKMKRTVEDLYKWKEKKDRHYQESIRKKIEDEKLETEKSYMPTFVNDVSKALLLKKKVQNRSMTNLISDKEKDMNKENKMDQTDIEDNGIDLWPAELNKLYA